MQGTFEFLKTSFCCTYMSPIPAGLIFAINCVCQLIDFLNFSSLCFKTDETLNPLVFQSTNQQKVQIDTTIAHYDNN